MTKNIINQEYNKFLADLKERVASSRYKEALKACAQHLKGHTVYYIGVFCDLAAMQEREVLRRDRCIGLSNDQMHKPLALCKGSDLH